MKANHLWVVIATLALTTGGCAVEGPPGEEESILQVQQKQDESQCGPTWDVQDVEQYDGTLGVSVDWVERHEGAVGYQVFPGCTGTLISEDLFISAGHCGYGVGDTVRFNYQDDPSGNPRPTSDFSVVEVVEQEDNINWDYAIVRLDGDPGEEFGYARLADRDEDIGDTVAIMQHPAGVPKVIHTGPVFDYSSPNGANWFRHQVDTTNGSSGSGILTTDGFLVGVHTSAGCDPGNSAMRITSLIDHSPTLQDVLEWQRGAHGWVWANNASSASYTPSTSYQWNSENETNTITRSGAGVYTVHFPELGASGISGNGRGGNVQVTAYDPGAYCKVQSWGALGTDVSVNIRCFDYDGNAADSRFVALFHRNTFAGFADEHGTAGYAWSQGTSYSSQTTMSSTYSWNVADESNQVDQSGTGNYSVQFPGVDEYNASVLVTSYGYGNERCQVRNWYFTTGGMNVNVYCTTPGGSPTNSRFSIALTGQGVPGRLAEADNAGAYAWANNPTSASYTPSTWYQGNDMGGDVTIDRSGEGDYLVDIPHPGFSITSDAVLVTAYGATGHQCLVDYWARGGSQTSTNIHCYDETGSPVDTRFTLAYLTSIVDNP